MENNGFGDLNATQGLLVLFVLVCDFPCRDLTTPVTVLEIPLGLLATPGSEPWPDANLGAARLL
eukprot:1590763-Amphidinium_carterae.1